MISCIPIFVPAAWALAAASGHDTDSLSRRHPVTLRLHSRWKSFGPTMYGLGALAGGQSLALPFVQL
jgi:hypothetical protein